VKAILTSIVFLLWVNAGVCEPTPDRLALAAQVADVESATLVEEIVTEFSAEMSLSTNAHSAVRDLAEAMLPPIQEEVVLVLAETFTANELRVLIRFNELEPVLSERCMRALENHLTANPQLTSNLVSRLKQEGKAQPAESTVPPKAAPSASPGVR